jgi:hypothetical protein
MIDLFIMYGGIIALTLIIAGCTRYTAGQGSTADYRVDVKSGEGDCSVVFEASGTEIEHTDDKEVKGP